MNKSLLLTGIVMLTVGAGLGHWLSAPANQPINTIVDTKTPLFYRSPMAADVTSPVPVKDAMGMDYVPVYAQGTPVDSDREILFYRSPMNPSVTSPVPAIDPMGMEYVPVYAEAENASGVVGSVSIDPVVVQNMGVRTAVANRETLSRTIRTVGRVDFAEDRMARLHAKVDGWVDDIAVDKTGQSVKENDILLSIYSPKLVSAQQEYLLALNNMAALEQSPIEEIRQGARALAESSRERLQLLDVAEHQISELEKTKQIKKALHIHTPVDGTVIRIGSRQGQYITPKTELYMVVDLSKVWVYADIYEYELPWVKVGDQVDMTLSSVPGKTFQGTVAYIYPYAESKTRTTKVRLVFDNRHLLLRPDMFAELTIRSGSRDGVVVVPAESIVRSGSRAQVFVVRESGKYEPRPVTLGIESNGRIAITGGLAAGETVVTSAQFLVDSESKLRVATAKMMEVLKAKETDPPVTSIQENDNDAETQHSDHGAVTHD